MNPEVPQVLAHRFGIAVDQPVRQRKLMKGLIPELLVGLRAQHPLAGPGHRRGEHQRLHQVGLHACHALGDAAADVVARQHRVRQAQLVDEAHDAGGLRRGAVEVPHVDRVLVRAAESAQIGDDDVGVVAEQWDHSPVVVAVTGPAVQQHHGRSTGAAESVERQPETVHRGAACGHRSILRKCQPAVCRVSESPVITARMLRHESDGELRTSECAAAPAISRPSS